VNAINYDHQVSIGKLSSFFSLDSDKSAIEPPKPDGIWKISLCSDTRTPCTDFP
jgi:hypothetical protein